MDNDSKLRLLYIEKMLQNTDEAHPLTNAEMMQILEEKYGMTNEQAYLLNGIFGNAKKIFNLPWAFIIPESYELIKE